MNNGYIAVFDSGLGGLTCVKAIMNELPEENIVFLADNANLPYGDKSKEEIVDLSIENIAFLNGFSPKALIIACNTIDSNALEELKDRFDLPIIGVITPAAIKAVLISENRKIGIMATSATVTSGQYERCLKDLDDKLEIFSLACPKFTPLIEEGRFIGEDPLMIEAIKEKLDPLLEKKIDTLILGCTHYDLLMEHIHRMAPELKIVSSSRCVVSDLKAYLLENDEFNNDNEPKRLFYATDNKEGFEKTASYIIDDIKIEIPD